jgi:hypothetical protein
MRLLGIFIFWNLKEFKIDYTFAEIEPINWTKNGKNFEPI